MKKNKSRSLRNITYVDVNEMPEIIEQYKIYVVGEGKFKWVAVMSCPCNCGDIIQLNLLREAYPCWKVFKFHGNKISIYPSILREIKCESHFIIRKGNLKWVLF